VQAPALRAKGERKLFACLDSRLSQMPLALRGNDRVMQARRSGEESQEIIGTK